MFLNEAFKTCQPNDASKPWKNFENFLEIIDIVLLLVKFNLRYVVVLLQIYEWHSMLIIIQHQDKLDNGQIMFEVNVGNYKLTEKRWKLI